MQKIFIFFAILFSTVSLYAQNEENKQALYPKHEIGFAVGAFPTVGILSPDKGVIPFGEYPIFAHTEYVERENGMYEKMYHLGAYTLNYDYHFNPKHSMGVSLSWLGRHIDRYWWYYSNSDTVNGSGWVHFFTLQGNYRRTYYRKNKISLYYGIHWGITLCVRDKDILFKEPQYSLLGSEGIDRYYVLPAIHLNAFGVEIGEKYVFICELGIGTQGVLKTGFKYMFL